MAYWTAEATWHSELQLRNNSPAADLTVTPSLRAADGTETRLATVTIHPQEVASIPLHEALAQVANRPASEYGSVVLRYRSFSARVLYAALMVHREARSIAFHIDGVGQLESDGDAYRQGIWWLPNSALHDYLVLSNEGGEGIPLRVTVYDAQGRSYEKPLTLLPRETTRLSVRDLLQAGGLSGLYGGIQVHALEHARALDTLHFTFDENVGFAAMLKMFDHDPAATIAQRDFAKQSAWILRAPTLALAHSDPALALPSGTVLRPRLLLRNAAGTPVTAGIVFNWRSATHTGQTVGPVLRLAPYETRMVDVFTLSSTQSPPDEANWSSVTITTSSKPDEVVAVAASYDESLRYGAQTPFSDQLSSRWEGGEWQADAMHDSITTVGNGGTKPMRAAFTLYYDQGRSRYDLEKDLAPNEQMWVDIGALIRGQAPDVHGKVLPPNLITGSYRFRDLTNTLVGMLYEGKVIYDLSNGHVSYGCGTCCSTTSVYLNYDPFALGLGANFTNGVTTKDNCGDPPEDDSGAFYSWTTASVAVARTTSAGTHTGLSVGGTTSSTKGEVIHSNGRSGCYLLPAYPNGPTNVTSGIPNHIAVVKDSYTAYTCPVGTSRTREINYTVLDNEGTFISRAISVFESVDPSTQSSCTGQQITTSYSCTPIASGNYTDTFQPGCPANQQLNTGCGYTFPNQEWEWCNPGGVPVNLGDVGSDSVENTLITIGGNVNGYAAGTTFPH